MANNPFVPGAGFPSRLETAIAKSGRNYSQIARQTRISRETLRQWLYAYRYPARTLLYRFSIELKLDMNWLLYGSGGEPTLKLSAEGDARLRELQRAVKGLFDAPEKLPDDALTKAANLFLKGRRLVKAERDRRKLTL